MLNENTTLEEDTYDRTVSKIFIVAIKVIREASQASFNQGNSMWRGLKRVAQSKTHTQACLFLQVVEVSDYLMLKNFFFVPFLHLGLWCEWGEAGPGSNTEQLSQKPPPPAFWTSGQDIWVTALPHVLFCQIKGLWIKTTVADRNNMEYSSTNTFWWCTAGDTNIKRRRHGYRPGVPQTPRHLMTGSESSDGTKGAATTVTAFLSLFSTWPTEQKTLWSLKHRYVSNEDRKDVR